MQILGLVARTHDCGLAIVEDGVPTLVLEEERLNREKHTRRFPFQALDIAFRDNDFDAVDVITTPWCMADLRRTIFRAVTGRLPASLNLLPQSARPAQSSRIVNLPMALRWGLHWHFGVGRKRLPEMVEVRHHDAHAAMFFVSPFEEAAVLVMDGYGDETSQSAYVGKGNRLGRLSQGEFFDSLGMLYTAVTQHLGFRLFEEGTVMALAATGGPTYVERFREIIQLRPSGKLTVNRDFISYDTHGLNKPFKQRFIETFGPARRRGEPIADRHRDLAFALQAVVEEAILHVVRDLSGRHPSRNLCLTGGVALNCVANQRILEDTAYRNVWIPPCASDAGAPLGSALWHYHQTLARDRRFELTHSFYGQQHDDTEMAAALDAAGLSYRRLSEGELLHRVARDIADGKIVGWFQGRSEIGPRALGNRSILADARDPRMKDRINRQVKHREAFRPFAPAVLEERLAEFFETAHKDPFMTLAPRVRADKREVIPAGVHVDGTARIQTVNRTSNPLFYRLIEAFAALTGVPIVLNTSFNYQEPIVQQPEEAVACFLRTSMDVLVLGPYYVANRQQRVNAAVDEARAPVAAE